MEEIYYLWLDLGGVVIMSTANIYTKEKVDELLNNLNSKFFILPSNITINTNGITIGSTTVDDSSITVPTSTIKTKLILNGTIEGNIIPFANTYQTIGTASNKWDVLWADNVGTSSYPILGVYAQQFVYKTGNNGSGYPLMHMMNCKKYTSYASSMVINNTTSYIGNSYWSYDCTHYGTYQTLKICTGTFVKAGGDNARKTVSFPVSFASAPLVILQMGGGNAPGNIPYRNGELVAEITTTGFTTASSCSEQARMCYIAIGC